MVQKQVKVTEGGSLVTDGFGQDPPKRDRLERRKVTSPHPIAKGLPVSEDDGYRTGYAFADNGGR